MQRMLSDYKVLGTTSIFCMNSLRHRGWYPACLHPFSSGHGKRDVKTKNHNTRNIAETDPHWDTDGHSHGPNMSMCGTPAFPDVCGSHAWPSRAKARKSCRCISRRRCSSRWWSLPGLPWPAQWGKQETMQKPKITTPGTLLRSIPMRHRWPQPWDKHVTVCNITDLCPTWMREDMNQTYTTMVEIISGVPYS